MCVSYFFMRNPYKKFQNSSMHVSKVMLCTSKSVMNGQMEEKTDRQMDEHPRSNMPLQLLQSWGHNELK